MCFAFVVQGIKGGVAHLEGASGHGEHGCGRGWGKGRDRWGRRGGATVQRQEKGNGFAVLAFVLQEPAPEAFLGFQGGGFQVGEDLRSHLFQVGVNLGEGGELLAIALGQNVGSKEAAIFWELGGLASTAFQNPQRFGVANMAQVPP